MDPAVEAPLVKDLPGLGLYRLSGVYAPHLDALAEPADNPVSPGDVEDIGKIIGPLPLQVVQMPLARHDLIGTAHLPQLSLGHLLGVD